MPDRLVADELDVLAQRVLQIFGHPEACLWMPVRVGMGRGERVVSGNANAEHVTAGARRGLRRTEAW